MADRSQAKCRPVMAARPVIAPGYQVPFAAAVKKASGMVVQAVGMIVDPHQAEAIVADGHADCVALARGFLDNPRWAWHAAAALSGCRLRATILARPARILARRSVGAPLTMLAIADGA